MSRAVRAAVAVLVAALVVGVSGPAQASRTVYESYSVPSNGVLRLAGHGWGHGHGMSQYGAQGAALQGLTYQQILAFYYPGTTLGTTTGIIRVLVSADTDHDVRILPGAGIRVRQPGSATYYDLPQTIAGGGAIRSWRLVTSAPYTRVQYDNGTPGVPWTTWKMFNGEAEFVRPGAAMSLLSAGVWRAYRGWLRIASGQTVNVVTMNDYTRGVVPREMPASWEPDAVRAQAVAARTYGAFDRAAHASRTYDTCDTTSCQVYGGVGAEDDRANDAVVATSGRILTYGGQPAFTQFSSSNGGWTLAGSVPYLVTKYDPYDGWSGNPNHSWTTTVTRGAIQSAYPSLGTLTRVVVRQREGHGQWYGHVESLVLAGTRNNVTVSGDTFRSRFGLKSSWFHFG